MRNFLFGVLLCLIAGTLACEGEPTSKQAKSGQTGADDDSELVDDPKTHGVKVVLGKEIREKNVTLNDYRIEPGKQQLMTRLFADLTFEKRMRRKIIATVFDPKGAEYTQILVQVESPGGGKMQTIEFNFDERLELPVKGKVVLNIADDPLKDRNKGKVTED